MAVVSMKQLLESGVHFGHRTHKWHPKMKPFIFTERNHIHIIDLQKTVKALEESYDLVRDSVSRGGSILFIGTKRQAQETIQLEATRCGMPWVTARWLGGTLTNWTTIRQRINELERLERMRDKGEFDLLTKKEALGLHRKIDRLEMLIGGIRNMVTLPDLLFIVDVRREDTAVHEANLLDIPIVAMVDTNCDPRDIDYIIPSNDDAIRAIKLIVNKIADAVLEGKAMQKDMEEEMPRDSAAAFDVDAELTDEDLLGDATLAKLEEQRMVESAAREKAELKAAETAEEESEKEELPVEAEEEEELLVEAEEEEELPVEAEQEELPVEAEEDEEEEPEAQTADEESLTEEKVPEETSPETDEETTPEEDEEEIEEE